jgi:hypothetical protein
VTRDKVISRLATYGVVDGHEVGDAEDDDGEARHREISDEQDKELVVSECNA